VLFSFAAPFSSSKKRPDFPLDRRDYDRKGTQKLKGKERESSWLSSKRSSKRKRKEKETSDESKGVIG